MGYIFPDTTLANSGNWDITCAAPTSNPSFGALEYTIQAKADRVAAMLVGSARTEKIEIKARNYAGPSRALSIVVSGLGVQPSE